MKTAIRKSRLEKTVEAFDTRLPRVSRRKRFEQRLNRQWRQQRRTLAIIGGAAAFLSGLLWPMHNGHEPAPRLAQNTAQSVAR